MEGADFQDYALIVPPRDKITFAYKKCGNPFQSGLPHFTYLG